MPSIHLNFCRPLLLLSSIFPSIRIFSGESALCIKWPKYWSFSFSVSPSNEYSVLISFRIHWFDLAVLTYCIINWISHEQFLDISFFFFNFYFNFFPFIFISWRLITLQYCSGFCHTLTWINHGFTCVPHPDSPLPPPSLDISFLKSTLIMETLGLNSWKILYVEEQFYYLSYLMGSDLNNKIIFWWKMYYIILGPFLTTIV